MLCTVSLLLYAVFSAGPFRKSLAPNTFIVAHIAFDLLFSLSGNIYGGLLLFLLFNCCVFWFCPRRFWRSVVGGVVVEYSFLV